MTNELYISRTKKAHSSHDSSHEHPALVGEFHFAWTENIRYDKLILIMGYFTQLRIAARISRIFL